MALQAQLPLNLAMTLQIGVPGQAALHTLHQEFHSHDLLIGQVLPPGQNHLILVVQDGAGERQQTAFAHSALQTQDFGLHFFRHLGAKVAHFDHAFVHPTPD